MIEHNSASPPFGLYSRTEKHSYNGFFIFRFSSNDDRDHVLLAGPWVVDDVVLALTPWTPEIRTSAAKLSTCVVWMRLPDLSPLLWTRFTLDLVVSKAGKIVRLDQTLSFLAKVVLLGLPSSLISPSPGPWHCDPT